MSYFAPSEPFTRAAAVECPSDQPRTRRAGGVGRARRSGCAAGPDWRCPVSVPRLTQDHRGVVYGRPRRERPARGAVARLRRAELLGPGPGRHGRGGRDLHALPARGGRGTGRPPAAARPACRGRRRPCRLAALPDSRWPMSTAGRVHLLSGILGGGRRVRAACSCGWTTTPRVSTDRALAAFRDEHGSDTPRSQDAANRASSSSVSGATHASCATSAHTVPQVLAAAAGSTTTSCTAAAVPMARRQIGQVHDAAGCSALSGGSARQRRGSPARQRTGTVHSGCTCAAYETPRRRHRRSARSLRHEVAR